MDAEYTERIRTEAAGVKGAAPAPELIPEETNKVAGTTPPVGNGEQLVEESPQGTPQSELERIQAMGGNDLTSPPPASSTVPGGNAAMMTIKRTERRPSTAAPDAWSAPIAEGADSPWGGNKPIFLPNTPANMPEPVEWNVTAEQTVAGQMASLMQSDSPVFKSIREQMQRARAASGGKNSLMADRAATVAMANMAFQIGAADAATLARSAEFNAAMANQYGLARQQFMHNAMLSEQNFRQATYIQRIQNEAQLEAVFMQTSASMGIAQLQASTQMAMQQADYEHQLSIMETNHGYNLETMGVAHGYDVDTQNRQFTANWNLGEQQGRQNIAGINAQGQWQTRAATVAFQRQSILQWQADRSANNRSFMDTIAQIRGNPNITSAQADAAFRDALTQYNAGNAMTDAFYGNPSPSAGQGNPDEEYSFDYTYFPPPDLGAGGTAPPPGGGG